MRLDKRVMYIFNKIKDFIFQHECICSTVLYFDVFLLLCIVLTEVIEGSGGKRALGFLLKSELCQKRSKFRMQFCLRVPNNVLHVFFPEVCIVFEILRMQKTLNLL